MKAKKKKTPARSLLKKGLSQTNKGRSQLSQRSKKAKSKRA